MKINVFIILLLVCFPFFVLAQSNDDFYIPKKNTGQKGSRSVYSKGGIKKESSTVYTFPNSKTVPLVNSNERRTKEEVVKNTARSTSSSSKTVPLEKTNERIIEEVVNNNIKKTSTSSKTVTLIVFGEGATKEEATKVALRSAIEQAYGTFVSASTDVLNDDIIKDEIATIASGNIESYKELSYVNLGSTKQVNIQAVVSIGKLVSYAKIHGMKAELSGATFMMNMKMKELNRQNELTVLDNLYKQMEIIATNVGLFDYRLEIGEPYLSREKDMYEIIVAIVLTPNKNLNIFWDIYFNTIKSIKLSEDERITLRKVNLNTYPCFSGYYYRYDKNLIPTVRKSKSDYHGYDIFLRNDSFNLDEFFFLLIESMCKFKIVDNIGNEFKIGYTDHFNIPGGSIWRVRTPYGYEKSIFCYDNHNARYKMEIDGAYFGSGHPTYRRFMDSDINSETKVKLYMKLKYKPDNLYKISSFNIIPISNKIQHF